MVDIKGLDKGRVLKALYDYARSYRDFATVDLSGDEFDERLYDERNGKGAAQRAVDSIRDEPKDGENADKGTEENPNVKKAREQAKQCNEAEKKIIEIVKELPAPAQMVLCMRLAEKFSMVSALSLAVMRVPPTGGAFTPPPFMRFDIRAGEKKERDIVPPPFPWDLSFLSRQG